MARVQDRPLNPAYLDNVGALERRITIAAVVIPFLGVLVAIALLWGGGVTARDLAILAVMYTLVGFGVTIGYHRLLTHRSFDAPVPVRAGLAILGSMSVQGAVIHWVADHRKHHTFADEDGDPHSPHTHDATGWRGVLGGIWHSHTGWLFSRKNRASARRYANDLRKDQAIRFVDRHFLTWVLLGLAIPFAAGFAISGGKLAAGATALVWGGLVRIFVGTPRHLERELHLPHVRPAPVRDRRREPQQLGGRPGIARRGLAPQPPRLPDVRPPRPPGIRARPLLRDHPGHGTPRARQQHPAPDDR